MGKKISIDLDDGDDEIIKAQPVKENKVAAMAASLPSAHKARIQALKEAERVQFSFTQIPKPIKTMFEEEAKRRGMLLKEYLFHCLKAGGLDIPDYSEIDGRRR
jgi:hypothetical protein